VVYSQVLLSFFLLSVLPPFPFFADKDKTFSIIFCELIFFDFVYPCSFLFSFELVVYRSFFLREERKWGTASLYWKKGRKEETKSEQRQSVEEGDFHL
jgi:hypothetical protein